MKEPLVSVPVITYNSSEYIIEGLESIKAQTYKNIELIISDDCSTDNTVELCREWLDKNKHCFVRVELVTTDKNTGVAGNCNRAIYACKGEWVKILSGDDKFLPYTIEGYIDYITKHKEVNICFAPLKLFGKNKKFVAEASLNFEEYYNDIKKDLPKQKELILKKMFIPGPGIFFKKKVWEKVNGYDENYPFAEEYPFFDKVILGEERVFFVPQKLYLYQVDENSLGRSGGKGVIRHIRDRLKYLQNEKINILSQHGMRIFAFKEIYSLKKEIAKLENKRWLYIYYFIIHLYLYIIYNINNRLKRHDLIKDN